MDQIKRKIHDLHIFGGPPAFSEKLHVGRPNLGNREQFLHRVNDILDHKWLTNNGPYVKELERKLSETTGAKHCIALCNGTMALEIAIRALNLKGEVIVPSFTFVATAHALQWQEIKPVFADISPETHTLDPDAIEMLITPNTSGIIGVHLWGNPCAVDQLQSIANRHNLKLMFDAAHAFGCSIGETMVGNFGNAEVFSFHATKFLNSFEGGAIATNDDELASKIRLMENFGFVGMDQVDYVGTNGKMSEVSAAMGLTSLESMDNFIAVNQRNYNLYKSLLAVLPGISMLEYPETSKRNYQYVAIQIDETVFPRDLLLSILHAENIKARRYFYPGCHRLEPYRSNMPLSKFVLPVTENVCRQVLALPTGTSVGEKDIRKICELISFVLTNKEKIYREFNSYGTSTLQASIQ